MFSLWLLRSQVTLTDYAEPVLRLLRDSVAANASCAAATSSRPLSAEAASDDRYQVTRRSVTEQCIPVPVLCSASMNPWLFGSCVALKCCTFYHLACFFQNLLYVISRKEIMPGCCIQLVINLCRRKIWSLILRMQRSAMIWTISFVVVVSGSSLRHCTGIW